MVAPITPDEVVQKKKENFPEKVIEAVNEIIAEHWNGHSATFTQKHAAARIANKMGVETDTVYKRQWLDFEEIYREAGWKVEYDKPGYNESYEATFAFTKKKK